MAKRAGDNELLGEDEKRPCPGPFQSKGELEDEVTLRFDDERELYVSSSMLKMASPVFKAMLESDFKEKETRIILLKSKRYEDFLTLLESLHPGLQTPITGATLFDVLPLADEYQMLAVLLQCNRVMAGLMKPVVDRYLNGHNAFGEMPYKKFAQADCKLCLRVLKCAHLYSIPYQKMEALNVLRTQKTWYYHPASNNKDDDCVQAFMALPDSLKTELLLHRLEKSGY